jgi:cell division protein FtsB
MRILQGLLVLIILGLQFRLWIGPGSLAEIDRLNQDLDEQAAENAILEARNLELLQEVEELKNGTDAIEELARQDLGLIKEGETFYMIVEPESEAPTRAGQQDSGRTTP